MVRSAVTDASSPKKRIRPVSEMSAPEAKGGQDYDDILGFPGDGFQDAEDEGPSDTMSADLNGGAEPMYETKPPIRHPFRVVQVCQTTIRHTEHMV